MHGVLQEALLGWIYACKLHREWLRGSLIYILAYLPAYLIATLAHLQMNYLTHI